VVLKTDLECGGKRGATPLWIREPENSSRAAPLSPHSKFVA